jgi:hypothetical protein
MSNTVARTRRSLPAPAFLAILLFLWPFAGFCAQTIDFESLPAPGNGTGGLAVKNQFAANGVIFNSPTALDFSQGIPIPNFAHSGTKAIELCYGIEFCTGPLEVTFTTVQRRVKVWVGYSSGLDSAQAVVLRAFDGGGNQVAQTTQNLGPSTGPIPVSTSLEVMRSPAAIRRVTLGFVGAEASPAAMFNNGIVVDDVEFDAAGPPPPCPATQPPGIGLIEPIDGQVVLKNLLTVRANLTTPDPFATLRIVITGPASQSATFGPMFVSAGPLLLANITGILFPGQNTVAVTLQDCFGTTGRSRTVFYRPDVTNTAILVIDENQFAVPGAQVFADGTLLGVTNTSGILNAPPLQDGVKLLARKFVTESKTYRGNHSTGSFQNWKYHAYITSATVNNNGSVTTFPVKLEPNPLAFQVLTVRKRNTIIGLHLVASIEWDASLAEMETVRQKLVSASQFLFNATDGQILLEQAEIVDDGTWWEDADYRVYANQSLRAYVDSPRGGFFEDSFWTDGSWVHVQIGNDAPTYAHEFGHYGFKVGDEYSDDDRSVRCTTLLGSVPPPVNPFQSGMPSASCMMFSQWSAPKLCSGRSENRHVTGTRQGDDSCWSTVADKYGDSRWTIRTPDSRGAIMGQLNTANFPMNAWAPRITFNNKIRSNLCAPIQFQATKNGAPQTDREIWLHTTYGADILEGKTDGNGLLTGTGIHVGDRVENLTIAAANCSVVSAAFPRPATDEGRTGFVPAAFQSTPSTTPAQQYRSAGPVRLELETPAFNVLTSLVPAPKGKGARVVVRAETLEGKSIELARPPTVVVKVKNRREPMKVVVQRAAGAAHSGAVAELPVDQDIVIAVSATDRSGHTVRTEGRFLINPVDPDEETDVNSSDGLLSLTIPAKVLPGGTRIAVGPSMADRSAVPRGYTVVSGPYSVSSNAGHLSRPAIVRFQLPHELDRPGTSGHDEKTFRILRQDPSTHRWEEIGGTLLPYPVDRVTAHTAEFGIFVLVAREASEKRTPSQEERKSKTPAPTRSRS